MPGAERVNILLLTDWEWRQKVTFHFAWPFLFVPHYQGSRNIFLKKIHLFYVFFPNDADKRAKICSASNALPFKTDILRYLETFS